MHCHIALLPGDRPLDVVGDVHGELEALENLLGHLGYDEKGDHAQDRFLVFVGDLVDRGPDSPGVVRLVQKLIQQGNAQCLLGNHELNLLLGKERAGNEWFYGREQMLGGEEKVIPQVLADHETREDILLFLQTLPLVAERADLRVVHACWHPSAVAELRNDSRSILDLFYETEKDLTTAIGSSQLERNSIQADLVRQNGNPVTALTSGLERETSVPFRAGGKVRHVERVAWWESYTEDVPVVFGHFWRAIDPEKRAVKKGPYMFHDVPFEEALGPLQNAYCVDYSVGYRNIARAKGEQGERNAALMALRIPEYVLVEDNGCMHATA
ncbi:MAG: metallophosphoesterase [Planctomycetota bacterium]